MSSGHPQPFKYLVDSTISISAEYIFPTTKFQILNMPDRQPPASRPRIKFELEKPEDEVDSDATQSQDEAYDIEARAQVEANKARSRARAPPARNEAITTHRQSRDEESLAEDDVYYIYRIKRSDYRTAAYKALSKNPDMYEALEEFYSDIDKCTLQETSRGRLMHCEKQLNSMKDELTSALEMLGGNLLLSPVTEKLASVLGQIGRASCRERV